MRPINKCSYVGGGGNKMEARGQTDLGVETCLHLFFVFSRWNYFLYMRFDFFLRKLEGGGRKGGREGKTSIWPWLAKTKSIAA